MSCHDVVLCNGTLLNSNLSMKVSTWGHRFVSPHIGALSDKYGRKRVLLITMIGNILSALVYVARMRASFIELLCLYSFYQMDTVYHLRHLHVIPGDWRAE